MQRNVTKVYCNKYNVMQGFYLFIFRTKQTLQFAFIRALFGVFLPFFLFFFFYLLVTFDASCLDDWIVGKMIRKHWSFCEGGRGHSTETDQAWMPMEINFNLAYEFSQWKIIK